MGALGAPWQLTAFASVCLGINMLIQVVFPASCRQAQRLPAHLTPQLAQPRTQALLLLLHHNRGGRRRGRRRAGGRSRARRDGSRRGRRRGGHHRSSGGLAAQLGVIVEVVDGGVLPLLGKRERWTERCYLSAGCCPKAGPSTQCNSCSLAFSTCTRIQHADFPTGRRTDLVPGPTAGQPWLRCTRALVNHIAAQQGRAGQG